MFRTFEMLLVRPWLGDVPWVRSGRRPFPRRRTMSDREAIKNLGLVAIDCDGIRFLVSLPHRRALHESELGAHREIPVMALSRRLEAMIAREAGVEYDGNFPGWSIICEYVDANPDLLKEVEGGQ